MSEQLEKPVQVQYFGGIHDGDTMLVKKLHPLVWRPNIAEDRTRYLKVKTPTEHLCYRLNNKREYHLVTVTPES